MTTCFYQMNTVFQTVLLVISQLTVIFLASELILLFSRKSNLRKQISVSLLLALNVTLYILMQLNSRITGGDKGFHLHIPYVLLTVVTLLSITLGVWLFLSETKNRKTINNASIKEAFDNQTVTVVSGVVCRELNGSTGSANFLTGTTDPMFVVTPKGGNGSYGYTWGFTYAGGGGTYTFKSQISDSYYDGENTNSLTIDRAWFNSHKNQFESFYCTIGSNGKAETVTIPIS